MKIWAVANQKGGVGKTTTAVTLAGLLAGQGYRTLLVDMDPHGSLTTYFGRDPDAIEDSVYNVFHDDELKIQSLIKGTRTERLFYCRRPPHWQRLTGSWPRNRAKVW